MPATLSAPHDRRNWRLSGLFTASGDSLTDNYLGLAGIYDSDYSYVPTPEQQAYAEQQVKKYLGSG